MVDLGKILVAAGVVIALAGAVILLAGKFNLPLGRLPGDFLVRGKNTTFYFPLTTCILVSVALTVIFWLVGKIRH